MKQLKEFTVGQLRAALKELKTATANQLAEHLKLAKRFNGRISSVLCTQVNRANPWLERVGTDGKKTVWGYVTVVDQLKVALESRPIAKPLVEPRVMVQRGPLDQALDLIIARIAESVGARIEQRLIDALRQPSVSGPSLAQVRAVVQADLGALEARLYAAFGAAPSAPTPTAPSVAPSAFPRRPRVLIFRINPNHARVLDAEFGKLLDLTMETDLDSRVSAAERYAKATWDGVVLNTDLGGHREFDMLSKLCKYTLRLSRPSGLEALRGALSTFANLANIDQPTVQ